MTPHLSHSTLSLVEAALPDAPGEPPRDIAARIGTLAPTTVRHALRELGRQGRAAVEGADCQRRYWKVQRT